MRMYFPEIYPDELVYSWLSRYFVRSGCTNSRMLLSQLLHLKLDMNFDYLFRSSYMPV